MDAKQQRRALVRARARAFAQMVRSNPGLAFRVPDEIVDWLRDEEIPSFFAHCREFRIVQREDRCWEAGL